MNWLDLLILIIIGASVVSGFSQGLVRIGVGFGSLIVAFLTASWFYGLVGNWFLDVVPSRALANLLGFTLLFMGVLILGHLLGSLLARALRVVGLSWADRLLGAAFGLFRGAVVVAVGLMIVTAFTPKPPLVVAQSQTAPYALKGARILAAITPFEIRNGFRRSQEQLERLWRSAVGRRPASRLPME